MKKATQRLSVCEASIGDRPSVSKKPGGSRAWTALALAVLFGTSLANGNAKTLSVNSLADAPDATPGDGVCETGAGNSVCTLRAALQESAPGGIVDFVVTGTIVLAPANGELLINKNLTVAGPGAQNLTLDGNDAVRVMKISGQGLNVSLSGLTITRGLSPADCVGGGGIFNSAGGSRSATGTVNIDACVITANTANYTGCYAGGGGIYNDNFGLLRITNSTISNNKISGTGSGSGFGGGIFHGDGRLEVSNSSVSGNASEAQSGNQGGGVCSLGGGGGAGMAITNGCAISNNTATGGQNRGGGIYNGGAPLTLSNSTVSNNFLNTTQVSGYTDGGGIVNGGQSTINDTTISGNTAGGIGAPEGGAIYNTGRGANGLRITNCTISGNSAVSAGVRSGFNFPDSAYGGAIMNNGGLVSIVNSRITKNLAQSNGANYGGAVYSVLPGTLNITESVLSENQALTTNQQYSGKSLGGAIYAYGDGASNPAVVNVFRSTFSGNSAVGGAQAAGGGAIFSEGGTLDINRSTLSDNAANSDLAQTTATATGGAISITGGSAIITNSTVGNNKVTSTSGGPSAVKVQGGGIYHSAKAAVVTVNNSTIAGNSAGTGEDQGSGVAAQATPPATRHSRTSTSRCRTRPHRRSATCRRTSRWKRPGRTAPLSPTPIRQRVTPSAGMFPCNALRFRAAPSPSA